VSGVRRISATRTFTFDQAEEAETLNAA